MGKLEKDKTVWSWLGLENIELFDFSSSSSSAWKSGLKLDFLSDSCKAEINEEAFSSRNYSVKVLQRSRTHDLPEYLLDALTTELYGGLMASKVVN